MCNRVVCNCNRVGNDRYVCESSNRVSLVCTSGVQQTGEYISNCKFRMVHRYRKQSSVAYLCNRVIHNAIECSQCVIAVPIIAKFTVAGSHHQ